MTSNESTLPVANLHEMFSVDEAGLLRWKARPASHFRASTRRSAHHVAANWNSRYAGRHALTCVTPFGHRTGRINGLLFYAHRVVWAMANGCWPEHEIDHINGDAGDNRTINLRDVPHLMNLRNQAIRKNNTSGMNGVFRYHRGDTWHASIAVNGRSIHLGSFATKEQAYAARLAANQQHNFHSNHGRQST